MSLSPPPVKTGPAEDTYALELALPEGKDVRQAQRDELELMPTPGATPRGPRGQALGPWHCWRGGGCSDLAGGRPACAGWRGHVRGGGFCSLQNQPCCRATKSPEPAVTRASSLHAALRHSQSPVRPPAPGPGQCLGVSSEWTVAGCPRAWAWRWGAPGPSSDAGGYLSSPLPPSPLTRWDTCPRRLRRAQPRNSDIWGQVCPHGCEHTDGGGRSRPEGVPSIC